MIDQYYYITVLLLLIILILLLLLLLLLGGRDKTSALPWAVPHSHDARSALLTRASLVSRAPLPFSEISQARAREDDLPLFENIILDLFPTTERPQVEYGNLTPIMEACGKEQNMQLTENFVIKVLL